MDLFDPQAEAARVLIDQLIAETELYTSSETYIELFQFVARLRHFAPFNAMLLHIQKPGLTYAATARDWRLRFGRKPKSDARALVVLRTMGPVDFVFDVLDTEGKDLPEDALAFPTSGELTEEAFGRLVARLPGNGIDPVAIDCGDASAGRMELIRRAEKGKNGYRLVYNRNHTPATRLVTVAHELAHLFLGHLGSDIGWHAPDRSHREKSVQEIEAETVAWLVARRSGVESKSAKYLHTYKGSFAGLDIYMVMHATSQIEKLLGLSANLLWRKKGARRNEQSPDQGPAILYRAAEADMMAARMPA